MVLKKYTQHYNAENKTKSFAKALRRPLTPAENRFWYFVRDKKLFGLKFRRQHPIGNFIADFYCHEYKLVIEIDGNVHLINSQKIKDLERDRIMKEEGLTVIRFSNEDVFFNPQIIEIELKKHLETK